MNLPPLEPRKCGKPATHRFTWPGNPESFICADHLPTLELVASAIGMYLQTVPLHESELEGETCRQAIK